MKSPTNDIEFERFPPLSISLVVCKILNQLVIENISQEHGISDIMIDEYNKKKLFSPDCIIMQ